MPRKFVYVVCGPAKHIRTLHRSLKHLRLLTENEILVVTDQARNECPIEHEQIVQVDTPQEFTHRQASIYLKTGLHRWLDPQDLYCYLDSDILAVRPGAASVFAQWQPPITFASDLYSLENNVARFSPWAVRCGCRSQSNWACLHLVEAIERKFGMVVPADWVHWNGGVFLFGPESFEFLTLWHQWTLEAFQDPYWETRDQGTLIATVWKRGLQHHPRLSSAFNFIVDFANPYLSYSPTAGYALKDEQPKIHPFFLHLYDSPLHQADWSLKRDVEERLQLMTEARQPPARKRARAAADSRDFTVVVSTNRWADTSFSAFYETLTRGLLKAGYDAHILLTAPRATQLVTSGNSLPLPADLPIMQLERSAWPGYRKQCQRLISYLEGQPRPCIYLPNDDIRHSGISAVLSNHVRTVGVVLGNAPDFYRHALRQGQYWNAIVGVRPDISDKVRQLCPRLKERVATILLALDLPEQARLLDVPESFRVAVISPLPPELPAWRQELEAAGLPIQWSLVVTDAEKSSWLDVQNIATYSLDHMTCQEMRQLFRAHHFLLQTDFLTTRQHVVTQAIAHGCLLLYTRREQLPTLIMDGITGYQLGDTPWQTIAARLSHLRQHPTRHQEMIRLAYNVVREHHPLPGQVIEHYIELFQEVDYEARQGLFSRERGSLRPDWRYLVRQWARPLAKPLWPILRKGRGA